TSPIFNVGAGPAVTAGLSGASQISSNPNVYGTCNGASGNSFFFSDSSSTHSSVATFFNESLQSIQGGPVLLTTNSNTSFTAQATNYTIIITATNTGITGTQAYTLLNNVVNNSFGVTNSGTVCLPSNGGGLLTYNVDVQSQGGIQNNYPGTTYQVTWGDGSPTSSYTICDIINAGAHISHTYTSGSCGKVANNHNNSFEVDIQPQSPYCVGALSPVTTYAKVLQSPTNSIGGVKSACTNNQVTFTNTSFPGQDPGNNSTTCANNPNARYIWSVDGTVVLPGVPLSTSLSYTFNTPGIHYVTLALQSGSTGVCTASPVTDTVCVQNAPVAAFSLQATACLSSPVIPADQSTVDSGCSTNPYLWTITSPPGAGVVTFVGGTTNASHQPQIKFSTSGTYIVTLSISSTTCATSSVSHTINIDAPPTITMSQNTSVCGTNITYNFNPNPGPTQTTITGTATPTAGTYTWAVTGDPGYTFVNGTSASSQYPQIRFTDFATYTITVTEQNSCGQVTKSQQITFQSAPTVTITPSSNSICPGSPVTLTGTIN